MLDEDEGILAALKDAASVHSSVRLSIRPSHELKLDKTKFWEKIITKEHQESYSFVTWGAIEGQIRKQIARTHLISEVCKDLFLRGWFDLIVILLSQVSSIWMKELRS